MFIVEIEHPVRNYDEWKKIFESDPLKREQSGVKRYRLGRLSDNPNYVVAELEFAGRSQADDFLMRLNALWGTVQAGMIEAARGWVIEVLESKQY